MFFQGYFKYKCGTREFREKSEVRRKKKKQNLRISSNVTFRLTSKFAHFK